MYGFFLFFFLFFGSMVGEGEGLEIGIHNVFCLSSMILFLLVTSDS